jgi:hypothetical protein
MSEQNMITLETLHDTLQFSPKTGRLVSFRSKAAQDQEFIVSTDDTPVVIVQYLDENRRFRQVASNQAVETEIWHDTEGNDDETTLTANFRRLGGLDVDVAVTVRASKRDRLSYWSLSLRNGTDLLITDVQFPFVVAPYRLTGTPGTETVLWPFGAGALLKAPRPQDLPPDAPHTWQMHPENGAAAHYPGLTFAQFLAYFNDRAGIYIGSQDASGMIKQIRPVHHEPGLRLGVSHVGDWPKKGERQLEYDVVVGSFTGDWYAAAELYRSWSLRQHWARRPLHTRPDIPAWLLDSPPHIILRIQGELDIGPTAPKTEFLPYSKAIPLLDAIAKCLDAPLVPVIMSWERPGPWIYPDCFPPAGGEESLREFTDMARERGWHIGTFCNGTRWVVGHYWSGYDGYDDFTQRGGDRSICRTCTGDPWKERWDESWRPSYACCLGTSTTREIAIDFVHKIIDLGLDWVQFLDQNVGCATFPCFATDHEHQPAPGRWMTEKMQLLVDAFHELGAKEFERSSGERQIVYSVECPINEYFMPEFQICDVRVVPPGHRGFGRGFIPLYHFLYHEFILIQGGFGSAPEPYHLPIRNAYNLVIGEIPGTVMKGDGKLLNWDTMNWAPWEPDVGDNEDALQMLRSATALRRGMAKEFLVYGQMMPPGQVEGIKTMRWQYGGHDHRIPTVFHAEWQAPDGRFGIVLANWTEEQQEISIVDSRLGGKVAQHISSQEVESKILPVTHESLTVRLPPLSCALLASHRGEP